MKIVFIVTYAVLKNKYIFMLEKTNSFEWDHHAGKQKYHRFDKDNLCED